MSSAEYWRAYRQANKEKLAEEQRVRYQIKKEKIAERQKKYNQAHKAEIAAYDKVYNEVNREKRRAYYEANKERLNANRKAYREAHKDLMAQRYRAATLLHDFGLTVEEWEALYEKQQGKCAICQKSIERRWQSHTDHCHITGRVRGILCHHCNVGLGNF